jgi:hypothetical protein
MARAVERRRRSLPFSPELEQKARDIAQELAQKEVLNKHNSLILSQCVFEGGCAQGQVRT